MKSKVVYICKDGLHELEKSDYGLSLMSDTTNACVRALQCVRCGILVLPVLLEE